MSARRPWKVFVRDIGPTFTSADEERARQRARDLTRQEYAEVIVWNSEQPDGLRRWTYREGECRANEVWPYGAPRWQVSS